MAHGLCECGCGQSTSIATRNRTNPRYVKGQPIQFVRGHRPPLSPDQFWARFRQDGEHWIWTGAVGRGGYGNLVWRGRYRNHHVVAFELTYGSVPTGKEVCHRRECHTKLCGRPDHLYAGTRAENVSDAKAAGWRPGRSIGEANGSAKLTAAQVTTIRGLLADGASVRAVAEHFGMSLGQIDNIKHRRAWRIE